ncbi:hypothetical protein SGFS_104160 [Streptomyces graminofaciens]|uniref:Transposase n=1 Tax=Streptomyces graminofaciens TaxID=68212 RepID=A0ABN5W7M8_9ACTN|nr:hypothetical protein SGFS_104160 [Streptomyces graminofaciens]
MFEQGIKPSEVARCLRVSLKSAYRWQQLWRDGGVQALASRGPSGSRCRLSPRCLEKLAGYLEQGPAAHGWVEDQVWTAARSVPGWRSSRRRGYAGGKMYPQAAAITDNWQATIVMLLLGGAVIAFFLIKGKKR